MSNNLGNNIISLASNLPQFVEKFDYFYNKSEQVIVFGSYAAGVQNSESDIDILFVSEEKAFKTRFLDFVCIRPDRIKLKSWLGTELANHISAYGIWVKGSHSWKHDVFISKNALERKKLVILHRLTHLWIKHSSISEPLMIKLFKDVLLDSYRLVHMSEGFPVPPNRILIDRFMHENRNIFSEISQPNHLGKVGQAFFSEIFTKFDPLLLNTQLKNLLAIR